MHVQLRSWWAFLTVGFIAFVAMACVVGGGCRGVDVRSVEPRGEVRAPSSVSHGAFTLVLKTYVDDDGMVDYARLKESNALDPYLRLLATVDPSELSEAGQLAFWINAYNAYTLKLIVDHYPVKSIRRITPVSVPGTSIYVPKINSPFEIEFARVGGWLFSLDEIEHEIIRKRFDEPRIHFALVCAAMSCPPLRREAYTADRLAAQLDDQAHVFLHDLTKNQIPADEGTIRLSSIFTWFSEDFGGTETAIQAFIAPYFEGEVRKKLEDGGYEITYLDYNWALNER